MQKRSCILWISLVLVLLMGMPSWSATSVAYEELACPSTAAQRVTDGTIYNNAGSAISLASLKSAYPDLWATVQVADYPIAWLTNGTPTASTKKTAQVGSIIWLEVLSDVSSFKAIGVGGTANLAITFYSGPAR